MRGGEMTVIVEGEVESKDGIKSGVKDGINNMFVY